MTRTSSIFKFVAALFLALFLISCNTKSDVQDSVQQKPNIVILFSDELQFEDISFCGGSIPTPHIDALAKEGLYFENTYTPAPMCTPSRYSLLSGRFPGRCSDPDFLEKYPKTTPYCIGWNTHLDSSVMTIPRLLSEQGYVTGMVGKWHVSKGGFTRGLVKMNDSPDDPAVNENLVKHQMMVSEKVKEDAGFDVANSVMFGNYDGFPVKALRMHNFPWFNKGAVDFIEASAKGDKPFFLYLAATSLHGPHHAEGLVRDYSYTPEGRIEGISEYNLDVEKLASEIESMPSPRSHRYTGMAFLDHQVGTVMAKLEELGIAENTVVIFLPDHNTEPGKSTCYEKGIKIPMFIKWPGKIVPSSKTESVAQTIDILPTVLEMAGVNLPQGYSIDGVSLLPVIENNDVAVKKYIYSESGYTRSVSDGSYKYIAFRYPENIIEGMQNGTLTEAPNHVDGPSLGIPTINIKFYPSYFDADQLFDLVNDPYEQNNLAGDSELKEKMAELQVVLEEQLATFDHPFDLSGGTYMQTDQFKALVSETMKHKVEDIVWYKRDWGEIIWPPVE